MASTSTACSFLHPFHTSTLKAAPLQRQVLNKPHHHPIIICQSTQDRTTHLSRRAVLTLLIGTAAVATKVSPADAAYGEAANVFGKPKKNTDFKPYDGEGFKLSIPAKWNPSKEVEYPGQVLRYEDNFDTTSNLAVIVTPTNKKSITDYGSPEEFLSQVNYLLGKQAYFGKTASEGIALWHATTILELINQHRPFGGFEEDAVATANILETSTPVINGKKYYYLSVLTRTADGDEGGKHQLFTATVSDGKLYICKAQAGDKRWFKGARKFVETSASSFSVA